MKKEEKQAFVDWMKEQAQQAPSMVIADYRGLTVAQITDLRSKCIEAGVTFKVAKNTLMRLAVDGTEMAPVTEFLIGPTAVAWHDEDPGAPARVLADFAKIKGNEALEIKGGAASGSVVSADDVKNVLATLPTREELLSQMAGLFAAGPQKLHRVLTAGPNMLGNVLNALKDKKEAA